MHNVTSSAVYGHPNVQCVSSFAELLQTRFTGSVNALCWSRTLAGDFSEVVEALGQTNAGVMCLDADLLRSLPLSADGKLAAAAMLSDHARLTELGLEPELNCIRAYPRAEGILPTDVYSFHVDEAPFETDTWLCTYYGPPSQGLPNEQAQRCVDIEAIRVRLLQECGAKDAWAFERFLKEHSYHLHYHPTAGARPWSFGVGQLWRIATSWPGCPVAPCIHRAPPDSADQRRLLLIS